MERRPRRATFAISTNSSSSANTVKRSPPDSIQSAPDFMCTVASVPVQLTPGIRKATML